MNRVTDVSPKSPAGSTDLSAPAPKRYWCRWCGCNIAPHGRGRGRGRKNAYCSSPCVSEDLLDAKKSGDLLRAKSCRVRLFHYRQRDRAMLGHLA